MGQHACAIDALPSETIIRQAVILASTHMPPVSQTQTLSDFLNRPTNLMKHKTLLEKGTRYKNCHLPSL
jgi:hypothetical protein